MKTSALAALAFGLLLSQGARADNVGNRYTTDPARVKIVPHKHLMSMNSIDIFIDGRKVFSEYDDAFGEFVDQEVNALNEKLERIVEAHKDVTFDTDKLKRLLKTEAGSYTAPQEGYVSLADGLDAVDPNGAPAPALAAPAGAQPRQIVLDVNALVQSGYTVVCPVCSKDAATDAGSVVKIVTSQSGASPAPVVLSQGQAGVR